MVQIPKTRHMSRISQTCRWMLMATSVKTLFGTTSGLPGAVGAPILVEDHDASDSREKEKERLCNFEAKVEAKAKVDASHGNLAGRF